MYHIQIYNRTALRIVSSQMASTEIETAKIARSFISRIKERCEIVKESAYDISPRGYVFGQTLHTAGVIYEISTAKA